MSLKIFLKKKFSIKEEDVVKEKQNLDNIKITALDKMVDLLKDISENIKQDISPIERLTNVYSEPSLYKVEAEEQVDSFIPSININENVKTVKPTKKTTKKRKLSNTINKLKSVEK